MTVRINKQKINLREKLTEFEDKVNFDEVVRGLGENTAPLILNKDGGNVGIGTAAPAPYASGSRVLEVQDDLGSELILSNSTTLISPDDNIGAILFKSYDGSGTGDQASPHYAAIKSVARDQYGSMNLKFYAGVRGDFENDVPHMVILGGTDGTQSGAGNVGIGTTNPNRHFEVAGNIRATKTAVDGGDLALDLNVGGGADHPTLDIYDRDGNDGARITGNGDSWLSANGGNVGIGTTSPNLIGLQLGTSLVVSSGTGGDIVAHRSGSSVNVGDICGALLIANSDTDGSEDHFVGIWGKVSSTNGSQDLHFAAGRSGYEEDTPHLTIDSGGNVGIGTTNPGGFKLSVVCDGNTVPIKGYRNTSTETAYLTALFSDIGGENTLKFRVEADGDVISATNSYTSDERAKTAISDLNYGIDTINQLQPKQFKMLHSEEKGFKYGFVAQEIETVLPDLVREDGVEDGEGGSYKALEYNSIIAVLTKAIQEQQAIIEDLKSRIETLESK